MAGEKYSVVVRCACKKFKDGPPVLDNLDMTVPRGSIYGLLGASGCGKTTLLSCIVGMKKLDSGRISVLGGSPGTARSGVPGPRLGFMPQDNAVVGEFTVKEAIYYFGWIHGMEKEALSNMFRFLSQLMQLPPSSRLLKHLSGGQLRRVSFASALIHTPELLILDEPTVGLDPVMRSVIWQYLVDLTRDTHMTIIITTHYIEEAKQADVIGLLRGGRLLAESSPTHLLSVYNTCSLEEVFLDLSKRQVLDEASLEPPVSTGHPALQMAVEDNDSNVFNENAASPQLTHLGKKHDRNRNGRSFTLHRVKAMALKNGIRISRHPGGIFYTLFFPVLELLAFYLAIGADPRGLRMAVVNQEMANYSNCQAYQQHHLVAATPLPDVDGCVFSGLGCGFLDAVDEERVSKTYYRDLDGALSDLRSGLVFAVVHVTSNFSAALQERLALMWSASAGDVSNSVITLYVDSTDKQLSNSLKTYFLDQFKEFAENISVSCDRPRNLIQVPINFKQPVYGTNVMNYAEFLAPGVIISLIYFLSVSLTSTLLIMEKVDGIWARTLVAGATPVEIMTSYLVSQVVQLAVQLFLVLAVAVFVFGFDVHRNVSLSIVLVALQGLAGTTFGFLMSAVCEDIRSANYFSLAVFYPYLFCSGILWPVQGMPTAMRYASYLMPGTLAIDSLRNLIVRGWGILEPQVFFGFLASFGWIVVQTIACVLVIAYKK